MYMRRDMIPPNTNLLFLRTSFDFDKFNRYNVSMKKMVLALLLTFLVVSPVFAVTAAPHITDREIVEKLSKLEAGQTALQQQINDLKESTNKRFDDMNRRFDDLNNSVNKRFDTLQWMLGLFTTVALVILGFVINMQWQMQRRQTQMETTLETQKDELAFLKSLIEKLMPPRGVL